MAAAVLERPITDTVPDEDSAPSDSVCEAHPGGKACWRRAEYSALITPHGCRRDNKMILLCNQCYHQIQGGQVCAFHPNTTIFIVRGIKL